jgi:hypothetical protein
MKKVCLALSQALLATTLTAAGAPAPDALGADELRQLLAQEKQDQTAAALASRPLFFKLETAPAAGDTLRFIVDVNAQPFLQETLVLDTPKVKQPAYELLAREPRQLEALYALAATKGSDVRIGVMLGARTLFYQPFGTFVAYNQALKAGGLAPEAPGTRDVLLLAAAPKAAPAPQAAQPTTNGACQNSCQAAYQACLRDCRTGGCLVPVCPVTAATGGELPDCSYCSDDYNYCLSTCPPDPPACPTSTTYNTTELVGVYYGGWQCYRDWFQPWDSQIGQYYQDTYLQYKISTIQKTTACDGSITYTTLSVSYANTACQRPIYLSCWYPFSYPYSICY